MQKDHNQLPQKEKQQSRMNRRRFLKTNGLAAVFSFFGITPFSLAHAVPASDVTNTPIAALQADPYVQAVLASNDYHRFCQEVQQKRNEIFTIQEHRAKVLQIKEQGKAFISVYIPVIGGAGHSFYSVLFRPQSTTILQAQDALFTPLGEHNVDVYVEKNGQAVLSLSLRFVVKPPLHPSI